MLSELLYADDLVLMKETIKQLRNKSIKWKDFVRNALKVKLGKAKVMVTGSITKHGLSKSEVGPCGVCSLRVKANSVLCVHCDKCIYSRCAGVKRVIF